MSVLFQYLRLSLFCTGLLVGIQVPALVDQYANRVDAHLTEAQTNLAGFRQTAERFFDGDLNRLIAHYRASDDPVFNADAASIEGIQLRVQVLLDEQQQLARIAPLRAFHVFARSNQTILDETMQAYTYTVPINPGALAWGLSLAVALSVLVELVVTLLFSFVIRRPKAI